jgi:hypothetical protein
MKALEFEKLYVAGPMRGYPDFNFPAFHAAAAALRAKGHIVFDPAEHDEESGFDPLKQPLVELDLAGAFRWDIAAVLQSDAVVVLPNWEDSEGAMLEVSTARHIGTPVLTYGTMEPIKPELITEEATRIVYGARQASYGSPTENFTRIGRMWGAILGVPDVSPRLVNLCLTTVQISRLVNAPRRETLVDLIGYAEIAEIVEADEARHRLEQGAAGIPGVTDKSIPSPA